MAPRRCASGIAAMSVSRRATSTSSGPAARLSSLRLPRNCHSVLRRHRPHKWGRLKNVSFEVVHAKPALIADFDESHRPCVPKILQLEACVFKFWCPHEFYMLRTLVLWGRQRILFFLSTCWQGHRTGGSIVPVSDLDVDLEYTALGVVFYKSRCAVRVCHHPCQDHGGGRGEEFADSWCSMDEVRRVTPIFGSDIKGFALWYVWRGTALACGDAHQKCRPNHFAGRDIRSRHLRKGDDSSARNLAGWQDPTCGVQTTGGFDGSETPSKKFLVQWCRHLCFGEQDVGVLLARFCFFNVVCNSDVRALTGSATNCDGGRPASPTKKACGCYGLQ